MPRQKTQMGRYWKILPDSTMFERNHHMECSSSAAALARRLHNLSHLGAVPSPSRPDTPIACRAMCFVWLHSCVPNDESAWIVSLSAIDFPRNEGCHRVGTLIMKWTSVGCRLSVACAAPATRPFHFYVIDKLPRFYFAHNYFVIYEERGTS